MFLMINLLGYSQEKIKYSFEIENVQNYQEAKPYWDDIRFFFNGSSSYEKELQLSEGIFFIILEKNISIEIINEYFLSKNISIKNLIITYE